MRTARTRLRLLLVATAALGVIAAPVAVAGAADDPRAEASASVKKTVKKLKQQVADLQQQVETLGQQQGPAGPQGPRGARGPAGPSTGPAGGDLIGSYPNPLIAGGAIGTGELADGAVTPAKLASPTAFIDSGLPGGGACAGAEWCRWGAPPGFEAHNPEYYRDPFGFVHLRGVAERFAVDDERIFQLPVGFRPLRNVYLPANFSTGFGSIRITGTGQVTPEGSPPMGTNVSLDGLTFRCGPSGSNGCP